MLKVTFFDNWKSIFLTLVLSLVILIPGLTVNPVLAQEEDPTNQVDEITGTVLQPTDVPSSIMDATQSEGNFRIWLRTIINFPLYFLGLIAMSVLIYSGYQYVISFGEEDKVDKAKKAITYAIIGIIIILLSYAVVNTLLLAGSGQAPKV